MTSPSSSPADAPLDDLDLALLDRVREMYQAADPMPEDLPERISFLLAMRDLEVEVARLAAGQDLLAGPGATRRDRAEDLRRGAGADREQRRAGALRLRSGAEGNRPAGGPGRG